MNLAHISRAENEIAHKLADEGVEKEKEKEKGKWGLYCSNFLDLVWRCVNRLFLRIIKFYYY